MRLAFIYGGQGSQTRGMGSDLYEGFDYIRQFYDFIKLDFPVKALSFCGDLETISRTRYTQPLLVAFQMAVTKILAKNGIYPDVALGLSIGEYTALYSAGVLAEKDVLEIVNKRGKFMEEVEKKISSAMLAVFTDDIAMVNGICKLASQVAGKVEISNINTKKQMVISGERLAVHRSRELLQQRGIKSVELNTSGPFHTSYMSQVAERLAELFCHIPFGEAKIPIIFNLVGDYSANDIKKIMAQQVCNKVLFKDSLLNLLKSDVDVVIEIGHGNVIKGFIKRINRGIKVVPANTLESIKELISEVKNYA